MAFCNQCGTKVEDGAQFCTSCGAKIDQGNPVVAPTATESGNKENKENTEKKSSGTSFEKFIAYTDTTASYAQTDIEQNRLVSVLSYISILVLVPLLGMKESPFAQYHAKVGLNLFIWHIVVQVISKIVIGVVGWIPVIGWIISLAFDIVYLALWAINIFGIVSAAQGKARELEIIAPFKVIK